MCSYINRVGARAGTMSRLGLIFGNIQAIIIQDFMNSHHVCGLSTLKVMFEILFSSFSIIFRHFYWQLMVDDGFVGSFDEGSSRKVDWK